jgi:hypothetical protein
VGRANRVAGGPSIAQQSGLTAQTVISYLLGLRWPTESCAILSHPT